MTLCPGACLEPVWELAWEPVWELVWEPKTELSFESGDNNSKKQSYRSRVVTLNVTTLER